MKVLLIEDDNFLSRFIKKALAEEGFVLDHVANGREGLMMARFNTNSYDLLILDILLPSIDGIEICKNLRGSRSNIPILMLSAKNSTESKVEGLNSGADDYLVKPFEMSELIARVKALLRRGKESIIEYKIKVRDVTLDTNSHEVFIQSKKIDLTNIEFRLLTLLMQKRGTVVKRSEIIEKIWDKYGGGHISNTVDVHIRQLRKKIKNANNEQSQYILTIRGVGYKFINE